MNLERKTYLPRLIIPMLLCLGLSFFSFGQKKTSAVEDEQKIIQGKFFFFNGIREKNLGNLDQAESSLRKSLEFNPANDAAHYELARILAEKGDIPASLAEISAARDLSDENNYYKLFAANTHLQLGQSKEALKLYQDIIKAQPENIQAYLAVASIYESQQNHKEANKYYELAEKKTGLVLEISQQKIANYMSSGRFDLAIDEVKKLAAEYPEEPSIREMLAELYQYTNNNTEAEKVYNDLLNANPKDGMASLKLAELSVQSKDYNKAFENALEGFRDPAVPIDSKMALVFAFFDLTEKDKTLIDSLYKLSETLIQAHQKDPKGYSIYGDILNREGHYEQARSQFRKAVDLAPDKHLIWLEILNLNSRIGDYESLAEESSKAIELFPTQPSLYFYQGVAYFQKNEFEKAAESLQNGLQLVIDNKQLKGQFYSALGDVYNSMKDYQKSDQAFDNALKIFPKEAYILNNYSYYLALRGEKLEKALKMAEMANKEVPGQPQYLDTYAWVLFRSGKYSEALKKIEEAFAAGGNSAEILEHYGDILFKNGKTADALNFWQRSQAAGNNNSALQEKINSKKLPE